MEKNLETLTKNWKEGPKKALEWLVDRYGEPDEMCENRVVWHETHDGWKKSVLVNQEVPHNFPDKHHDYLEQFIDYKVPTDMFCKLAEYDGSVIVERTKGEMSARCGGTAMNFVAINLAHEIIEGKRNVEEARQKYSELFKLHKEGGESEYTTGFVFELPEGDTKDIDEKTI